jgi:hypothetical protein
MIGISLRISCLRGSSIKSVVNQFTKAQKPVTGNNIISIFRRSGATVAYKNIKLAVDEGVPRIGK